LQKAGYATDLGYAQKLRDVLYSAPFRAAAAQSAQVTAAQVREVLIAR